MRPTGSGNLSRQRRLPALAGRVASSSASARSSNGSTVGLGRAIGRARSMGAPGRLGQPPPPRPRRRRTTCATRRCTRSEFGGVDGEAGAGGVGARPGGAHDGIEGGGCRWSSREALGVEAERLGDLEPLVPGERRRPAARGHRQQSRPRSPGGGADPPGAIPPCRNRSAFRAPGRSSPPARRPEQPADGEVPLLGVERHVVRTSRRTGALRASRRRGRSRPPCGRRRPPRRPTRPMPVAAEAATEPHAAGGSTITGRGR